ncbi:hypothetical protein HMPREF1544_06179, partial [Mucor circinelloides 1006PhL]
QRPCIFLPPDLNEFFSCLPFSRILPLCFRRLPHDLSSWVISITPTPVLLRPGIDRLLFLGYSTLMTILSMVSRLQTFLLLLHSSVARLN